MTEARDARFWDRIAPKYAASRISDEAGYEHTLRRTLELLQPGDRVLEFGCGTGATALRLAPRVRSYLGTDLSPGMIAIARRRALDADLPGLAFAPSTLAGQDPSAAPYDAVLGFNVLHLVPDLDATLRRANALLRPGGLLITKTLTLKAINPLVRFVIPVLQALGRAPHLLVFSALELERAIAAAGFDIVAVERHASRGRDARPFIVARRR